MKRIISQPEVDANTAFTLLSFNINLIRKKSVATKAPVREIT